MQAHNNGYDHTVIVCSSLGLVERFMFLIIATNLRLLEFQNSKTSIREPVMTHIGLNFRLFKQKRACLHVRSWCSTAQWHVLSVGSSWALITFPLSSTACLKCVRTVKCPSSQHVLGKLVLGPRWVYGSAEAGVIKVIGMIAAL